MGFFDLPVLAEAVLSAAESWESSASAVASTSMVLDPGFSAVGKPSG